MKSFSIKKFSLFALTFGYLASPAALHAISFTGNTDVDFPPEACFDDPNGQNVGIPANAPANTISGWDVKKICFIYSKPADTLYVGIRTFDNVGSNTPIIFGDADGDGNPGGTSSWLNANSGVDYPNLSVEEYFALVLDFDATPANLGVTPEVV